MRYAATATPSGSKSGRMFNLGRFLTLPASRERAVNEVPSCYPDQRQHPGRHQRGTQPYGSIPTSATRIQANDAGSGAVRSPCSHRFQRPSMPGCVTLPDSLGRRQRRRGTWSAFDVVAHLIDAEVLDWIPRTKWILEHGDSKPFLPSTAADTDACARQTIPQLLDEFAQARSASLKELRDLNLQPEDFQRRGRHPVLGEVTLSQLLSTWVVHDLSHAHQIRARTAHQHLQAVGHGRGSWACCNAEPQRQV